MSARVRARAKPFYFQTHLVMMLQSLTMFGYAHEKASLQTIAKIEIFTIFQILAYFGVERIFRKKGTNLILHQEIF